MYGGMKRKKRGRLVAFEPNLHFAILSPHICFWALALSMRFLFIWCKGQRFCQFCVHGRPFLLVYVGLVRPVAFGGRLHMQHLRHILHANAGFCTRIVECRKGVFGRHHLISHSVAGDNYSVQFEGLSLSSSCQSFSFECNWQNLARVTGPFIDCCVVGLFRVSIPPSLPLLLPPSFGKVNLTTAVGIIFCLSVQVTLWTR